MSRGPKNFVESVFPLLLMYAVIGHAMFRFPAHRQHPIFSIIYTITVTILYLIALRSTLVFIYNGPVYGDDERIVFLVIYFNVGIAVFGVILSWINAKGFARMIEDLTKVDETLQQLGGTFDYLRTRNTGYRDIFLWISIIVTFNCIDTLWFHDGFPIGQTFLIVSVLHHPVHLNSIIAYNFTTCIRIVGARYKEANKILENLGRPLESTKINAWQRLETKISIRPTFTIFSHQTPGSVIAMKNRKYFIQIIKHVHLELGKLGKKLNAAYGIHMALEIAALFVMFTGVLYDLYISVTISSDVGRYSRIVVLTAWISIYFVKIILVNEVCESVCIEARRTGEILHRLDENIGDSELPNEISQFSLQLLNDPLTFSPAGLMTLGHQFMKRFMAGVSTYLLMLIQMTPR